jgi:hypothetical protein
MTETDKTTKGEDTRAEASTIGLFQFLPNSEYSEFFRSKRRKNRKLEREER